MERIKQALERSREEGRETLSPFTRERDSSANQRSVRQESITRIVPPQFRVIETQAKTLADSRVINDAQNDDVVQSYKVLRTQVLQRMRANRWKTIAVTSPKEGEGKTVTAINLAVSLSKDAGTTVLVVDADLRRPSIHRYFDCTPEHGLKEYLEDGASLNEIFFSHGIESMIILPAGSASENSSELLSSPKMTALIRELKEGDLASIVIFDLPPALTGDDVLAFSSLVDCILLVVEDGHTNRKELKQTISMLPAAKILGTVLNKSEETMYEYY